MRPEVIENATSLSTNKAKYCVIQNISQVGPSKYAFNDARPMSWLPAKRRSYRARSKANKQAASKRVRYIGD
jgi:hypothetical protein